MGIVNAPLTGNVAQAGDIVLFALVLGTTFVVGLVLFGIDAVVGRLGGRVARRRDSTVGSEGLAQPQLTEGGTPEPDS